jgi:hypothetical protein
VTDAAFSGETYLIKALEAIAIHHLTMHPGQAAQVTAIWREHAPQGLQGARSFVLRNGLEQAAHSGSGASGISFAKFRRELDKVPAAGVTSRNRPPPSNSFCCFAAGLALRIADR